MSDSLLIKNLNFKEGERLVKIVRHYPLTYFFSFSAVLILTVFPFFFLFPLFSWGIWGMILFSFLLCLGFIYGARELVIWYFNSFLITTQRIVDIDQKGFFDRTVSEALYGNIQDVSYRVKGIFPTILNYGVLQIQTAGAIASLELRRVRKPQEIQDLITQAIEDYRGEENDLKKIPLSLENIWKEIINLDSSSLNKLMELIKEKIRDEGMKRMLED